MQPPDAMAMTRSSARQPERLDVDDRVLPDLRIDQLPEGEGEHALLQAAVAIKPYGDEPPRRDYGVSPASPHVECLASNSAPNALGPAQYDSRVTDK